MNVTPIGNTATKPQATTDQALRALAFVLVVLPTAISLNVLIWTLAVWIGRN